MISQFSGHDSDHFSPKKMAIPRLAEGAEAAFSTPGRFHRRHVRRACESCRQRKTKCTGDKAGCRNCREAGIICCYTDGKREKSKRQLASLSAKVQAYEDVIKKLSTRLGVSDEQLMSMALSTDQFQEIALQTDASNSLQGDCAMSLNPNSVPSPSKSSSGDSAEVIDHTDEDFNRDDIARATGYIGKSSEIIWLQNLTKEVDQRRETSPENGVKFLDSGLPSPSTTPNPEAPNKAWVALFNYYLDDLDMPGHHVDAYDIPSRETASRLLNAYLTSVHPSFPIIGISTFLSQFQVFFNQTSLKPGNKWLAILNLIFAIGAKYLWLTDTDRRPSGADCWKYFAKAKALSMDDQLFQHPDLQQLQVEGLAAFYLLAVGHINRSWKLCGSAVRGSLALGLHLRNRGSCTSDISKEIRYRVWWSLYSLEHLLCSVTGRPTGIVDNACTTPLPVPFDENDFQKDEVSRLIGSSSRGNLSRPERLTVCSGGSNLNSQESGYNDGSANSQDADLSKVEYLQSLPPCMSLYFVELVAMISISRRMTNRLYSSESTLSPWPSIKFTIQSLMLEIDSWLLNLPAAYDFTSTQSSQCPQNQRMGLACLFYSTRIGITRPCLCRLESSSSQGDDPNDFCSKTATECVESACQMLTLFPDTTDACALYKVLPWWCILHYLMQATTVLLLELSLHTQHVPDKSSMVTQATKKAIEWLHTLSTLDAAAQRAWKRCDGFFRRLAPSLGIDTSDLPCSADPSAADSPAEFNFDLAATTSAALTGGVELEMNPTPTSPMKQSNTELAVPGSYGREWPDVLDPMKSDQSLAPPNTFDDLLPYDPTTGQITGSFFPTGRGVDMDLGYFWCDPLC